MEQPHENAPRLTPNHFELKHAHTTITYDTAAFDGKPRLSYHAPHYHTAQTFSGDQIRTQPHAIGSLITVTLQVIPDLEERLLTLLLPAIQLVGTDEEPFQAVGIL
ncbi:MAG: hypothetical protein J2P36_32090, partial [Ktedonobacteraceae bacterium]|nr:hypothetical protein [Ktedonobacteraceae bacterium]